MEKNSGSGRVKDVDILYGTALSKHYDYHRGSAAVGVFGAINIVGFQNRNVAARCHLIYLNAATKLQVVINFRLDDVPADTFHPACKPDFQLRIEMIKKFIAGI